MRARFSVNFSPSGFFTVMQLRQVRVSVSLLSFQ
jgi:hypothetical protein